MELRKFSKLLGNSASASSSSVQATSVIVTASEKVAAGCGDQSIVVGTALTEIHDYHKLDLFFVVNFFETLNKNITFKDFSKTVKIIVFVK